MNARPKSSESGSFQWSELTTRAASALILATLAVAFGLIGDWPMTVLAAIMAAVVSAEWISITRGRVLREMVLVGGCAVAAVALAGFGQPIWAVALIAVSALTFGIWRRATWISGGIVYAAGLGVSLVVIRADPVEGLRALGFVAVVVWGTDIAAYFAGRRFGGPKLWPAVSPNKTWSGALGGAVAGTLAGVVAIWLTGGPVTGVLAIVALVLSVISQLGDLFESSIKRRFGVKDASRLIPGHGGLMDRVDGLTFAAIAAALVGWLHAGASDVGQGLLIW
ncbi:MAG: phosphatidate cytidylyltransferase [Alphaproteobacteria bacterium]